MWNFLFSIYRLHVERVFPSSPCHRPDFSLIFLRGSPHLVSAYIFSSSANFLRDSSHSHVATLNFPRSVCSTPLCTLIPLPYPRNVLTFFCSSPLRSFFYATPDGCLCKFSFWQWDEPEESALQSRHVELEVADRSFFDRATSQYLTAGDPSSHHVKNMREALQVLVVFRKKQDAVCRGYRLS